jgi:hypothetical protein
MTRVRKKRNGSGGKSGSDVESEGVSNSSSGFVVRMQPEMACGLDEFKKNGNIKN